MGVGIFSDCVFFLKVNSLPFKEKANLKTCITSNGGDISFVVNEKCTHVVVVNNAALNSSQQKNIQKHCIPIVKPDFIWRSIQENQLVEVVLSDSRALEVNLDQEKDDKKSKFLEKFMKHTKTDIAKRDYKDDVELEAEEDEKDLPHDTEVAKYSFFQKGEEVAVVELLCFSEKSPFPFKISTMCGIPGTSQKEFSFNLVDASEKACNKYEQRMKDLENKGFIQIHKIKPEAEFLASQVLQKVLLGEALNVTQLSPEVGGIVESIWTEAQGHLSSVLSCPVENISLNDVSKAEGILQNVRNALNKNENIRELMQEFYQCIPHRIRQQNNVDKKFLTAKQDLCQLIRDMVNISETSSSRLNPGPVGKFRALKCRVEYVDPNTEEFHRVKQEVLDHNHSNEEFQILRVFRVGRLTEATNFKSDLGNVKSLLHASSPRNIVGILSRGLLLPKMIVDEFGLERTDIGNLGSGIYFSDSVSTSVKYTEACRFSGERLLLVCDVALGKTKDVGERDYSITEPPEGFHSLHGVRSNEWKNSQFIDDEYVVYNVDQVKMRYVVQFCTSKDKPNLRSEPAVTLLEENEQMTTCEPIDDDSIEVLPEATAPKGGLQGMDGQQIPLESICVKARLKDLAAQVVIFQTYKNNSLFPIEAKYVFPLDKTAAVCGFEAFINGKHIVGEVKEKQQAHREYRTAISQGHGAYLMDQDAPDVFTVSVGNLPAKATVIIKITYVTELDCSYSSVSFSIPGTVASWQEDQALKGNTQDTVAKVGIEGDKAAQGNFSLDMSIEMPRKIETMYCFSHSIKKKQTDCKAVIQVEEGSSLTDEGFSLVIQLESAYIPRMWVESHPDQDSEACMLIFEPEFEDLYEEPKITICLDCSNSMESCFQSAKRVALLAVETLICNAINIITFGSTYKECYLYPKQTGNSSEMEKFIKMAKPNMGSTEFWKPLQSTCLLKPSSGHHKILLISDGHLQNDNLVFQILKKNQSHIKLFTCGVGAKANKHMLRCLAKDGAGAFEYFADQSKSSWKSQMAKHDSRLQSAACTAVSVKWRLFGSNPAEPMQAPANIQSLYARDCLFVYGFVPHCTEATLKAFINNKEFENMVSTTELQKTTGTILHKLTARAFIRDYEDGILHEKEHENEMEKQKMKSFIIKLSKEYSIVTQFTSFVAVEKRSTEESENVEPNILEILSAEDVDILPYMGYTDEKANSTLEDTCVFVGLEESSSEESDTLERDWGQSRKQEITPESEDDIVSDTEETYCSFEDLPATRSSLFGMKAATQMNRLQSQAQSIPASFGGYFEDSECLDSLLCPKERSLKHSSTYASFQALPGPCPPPPASSLLPAMAQAQQYGHRRVPPLPGSLPAFGSASIGVAPTDSLPWSKMGSVTFTSTSAFGTASVQGFSGPRLPSPTSNMLPVMAPQAPLDGHRGAPPLFGSSPSFGSGSIDVAPMDSLESNRGSSIFTIPGAYGSTFSSHSFQSVSRPRISMHSGSGHRQRPSLFGRSMAHDSLSDSADALSLKVPYQFHLPKQKDTDSQSPGSVQLQSAELFQSAEESRYDESLKSRQRRGYAPTSLSYIASQSEVQICPPITARPSNSSQREHVEAAIDMRSESQRLSSLDSLQKKKRFTRHFLHVGLAKQKRSRLADLTWSSFSPLQSQEGYWTLTPELGILLNIDVKYFSDRFLTEKGISSLGSRGREEVMKLIATLLVLQTVRTYNLLSGITFKTLMKLDQCDSASESYVSIEKAVNWAVKTDGQYSGICSRLGMGRDWEHATRQLLGIEPPSSDLSLAVYH